MRILTTDHERFKSEESARSFVKKVIPLLGEDYDNGYITFDLDNASGNTFLLMTIYDESSVCAFFVGEGDDLDLAVYRRDLD